jgi:CMP-N-acetylneuraminic acid synthetase
MYKKKKILAIIPARGGSKGLPGKNIRKLLGKPLIAWTIEQAKASRYIDKIIVSTDDKKIAQIARKFGAEVPFLRPRHLATDSASSVDVVLHVLNFLAEEGDKYDYIALLEPTSPLRRAGDIDEGIAKLVSSPGALSLVSVGEVHLEHPVFVKKIREGFVIPYARLGKAFQRQQTDAAFFPYGVLYLSRVDSLFLHRTFYTHQTLPLLIQRWQNYEIDDGLDFMVIERLMKQYYKSGGKR